MNLTRADILVFRDALLELEKMMPYSHVYHAKVIELCECALIGHSLEDGRAADRQTEEDKA